MEVETLTLSQYKSISGLYKEVIKKLIENNIFQWDRYYPNRFILFQDLWKKTLFGVKEKGQLLGVVVLNIRQSKQYKTLEWDDKNGNPLIIHRLAVHPGHLGKGIGKNLLRFAEDYAKSNGFSSIRLDVYKNNPGAVSLYKRAGYAERGEVFFPFRKDPYLCLEKVLKGEEIKVE
jgi:ribosomal protein S18 acetylase RimI-like enzyme